MATIIEATDATPQIILDFAAHKIAFSGESYPEDVNHFYGDIMKAITAYLKASKNAPIVVDLNLKYFNSSSTKVFYNLFEMLEEATEFNSVTVNWHYAEEDDMALETGESFQEDLENVRLNLVSYS
jgi:hypothetical protein